MAVAGITLGLMGSVNPASADSSSLKKLSAEWWQWALSIPTPVNPQLDATGEDCVVGQRGSLWFLAGIFGGGTATRTCSIPANAALYVPVINSVVVNTPDICGQVGSLSVEEERALAAPIINNATNLSVELDGTAIQPQRVQSEVFAAALPDDNIFVQPCAGDAPGGIFSPSIDDGFYVLLKPLAIGTHTLHFHAESGGFVEDVTYELTVVPVLVSSAV
jgi:hypothetical protein